MPQLPSGFNANEYDELDDFEPMPKGEYLATGIESEMKETKKGDGHYLQITWEVIEGEYQGRKLWSRLNLDNPNQTAVDIAKRELASICRATGVYSPRDSDELLDKPIVLKVKVRKRQDTGDLSNEIAGYMAAAGNSQQQSPSRRGNQGASQQKSAEKPPWA